MCSVLLGYPEQIGLDLYREEDSMFLSMVAGWPSEVRAVSHLDPDVAEVGGAERLAPQTSPTISRYRVQNVAKIS